MKTLKAIGAALVLALSLSIPAFADTNPGDAHTPGRSTSVPYDPTAKPENMGSTVTATQTNEAISRLIVEELLWALASIY